MVDLAAGKTLSPSSPSVDSVAALLTDRHIDYVTFDDWLKLDQIEQEQHSHSQTQGNPN